MAKKARHIVGLSGGKDSTALAVLLRDFIPNLEYFFCDTGKELRETYEYINKIEARLGIRIKRLNSGRDFDYYLLDLYGGLLPSPQVRWCTRQLKIIPLEIFIGDDITYSYIGIRADEERVGYISAKPNIIPVYPYKPKDYRKQYASKNSYYEQLAVTKQLADLGIDLPLREDGYKLHDVHNILLESGIGLPDYYDWRTRSGCYFCFFQRKYEWVKLSEEHPDLFEKAVSYEENHADGRQFFWNQGESLRDLLKRRRQILADHELALARKKSQLPNKTLVEVMEDVLNDEDGDLPCLACHL